MIHPNLHTPNCCITNAGDKRFRLRSLCADADRVRFVANTRVAYIDVVIACGEIGSGLSAQCDVAAAGCVPMERLMTAGRVVAASGVVFERLKTIGRVVAASGVALRAPQNRWPCCCCLWCCRGALDALGRVFVAGCVLKERINTVGRVGVAGCVAEERMKPVAVL